MDELTSRSADLFNSPLEAGIRAVTILETLRPAAMDLSDMVLLDHLVVHSGDLNGPESLHPKLPGRKGELLVRRRLVEDSLDLMRRFHLIELQVSDEGLAYRATEEAASYVELLESEYSIRLKCASNWIADEIGVRGKGAFLDMARRQLGEWTTAFIDQVGQTERQV